MDELHQKNLHIDGIFTNTKLNVINYIQKLNDMKKIQCPVSVITGDDEPDIPFQVNRFYKPLNPNILCQFLIHHYFEKIKEKKIIKEKFSYQMKTIVPSDLNNNGSNDNKPSQISIKLNVLAVDDNETNQLVVSKMLKKLGCTYKVVKNGVEAIDAVLNEDFDLVLMDQFMPILSGPEAARIIRNKGGKYETLPIVAMTASILPEDEHECLSAGMNGFIPKPVTLKILYQKLMEFCPKESN